MFLDLISKKNIKIFMRKKRVCTICTGVGIFCVACALFSLGLLPDIFSVYYFIFFSFLFIPASIQNEQEIG